MNVAMFGAGLMGRPMAQRLKDAGHSVTVYNRTISKVADLPQAGIPITDRPEGAIREAECLLLMLADARAIRDVLLTSSARQELAGRTVIQMGTISPRESQSLQSEIHAAGGGYLEAPVLGSITEVHAGKLIVMVGASPDQFRRWAGILQSFSTEPRLIGPVGKAAALKLALNHFIAAEMAAFALSLGLIERQDVPIETFMQVLRASALYAPTYDKKLPRLLKRDYTNPNFSTRHMLKDVNLVLQEAGKLGLTTSSLDGVPGLLEKTIERGLGDEDYSALYETVNPSQDVKR